jgi:putative membrane protein
MKKIKLFLIAFAATCLMLSCDNKRQESQSGSGSNEGLSDNDNNANNDMVDDDDNDLANRDSKLDDKDAKERAEEVNDRKFEADSAENQSEFIVDAAEGGLFEVEAAKIAEQKATNSKVKTFAKHMLDDHSKANKELKALAAKNNVTIPSALGEDKMDKIAKLNRLSGHNFDKEYIDLMVKDHKEDVRLFEKESKGTDNNEVESWAAKILPTLQKHLEMAQQTKDEVDKMDNTARK